ncbi:MAG TPA: hypothetical protein VLA34_05645, partial [Candidatus Krumholzibacterium sp.]|nr:hypothetical protein [Candidatus Krumholzibacterium sp.]
FYDAPDPWEGRIELETVSGAEPSFMGRQRVLPVRVNPVSKDGESYSQARRLRVTVSFEGPPSDDPSGTTDDIDSKALPVSSGWQEIYDRMLVNPSDVSRLARPAGGRRPVRAPAEAGRRLKIRIPETGAYSLRADSLIAAGLSPSLSNTGFALKKYYFDESEPGLVRKVDIPYRVVKGEASTPGLFSGDDLLVFYVLGLKDDSEAGDLYATYTDHNVVWLEEDVAGSLMTQGTLPAPSGLAQTVFEARHIERKDTWFENNINAGSRDFYFLQAPVSEQAAMPFIVNDPAASGTFSLTIRLMGLERFVLHQFLSFSLRNSSGTYHIADDEVSSNNNKTFEFGGLPASWLVDGQNELLISSDQTWGFTVNDFEIVYPAGFTARDGMLEFVLQSSLPPHLLHITGFDTDEGYIIDITDPLGP